VSIAVCTEWSDVAHEYLRGLGINADDFKHKLYVVPPGDMCSWGGMGYVGCTKDCRVWVSGDLWQVIQQLHTEQRASSHFCVHDFVGKGYSMSRALS
jgi:hypothetical protein